MRAILKENMANYISLERLINVDLGKKNELPVFFNSAKENRKQPQIGLSFSYVVVHEGRERIPQTFKDDTSLVS